jgi:hypothetical protein
MPMPRPVTLALSATCVGLIGLLAVLFFKKGEPPRRGPPEERDPVTRPASPQVLDARAAPGVPAAPARRPPPQAPARSDARQRADEASLLEQLHELAGSNPDLSLKLAREAVSRFPDSPDAPEFEWNVVKALFNLRRLDDAEAEARIMVSKYPDSSFTGDVVHHLLHHPPNPSDVPP